MNNPELLAGLSAFSYLLGAIPTGLMLARIKGVDIRKVGSGNIGATNVFRSAGKTIGIVTLLLDILKGFIPAFFLPQFLAPDIPNWAGLLFGALAIVGHNWPVYLKFKGGKGVATTAGMLLGVAPAAVGIALGVFLVLFLTTRYISVGSIAAAATVAGAGWLLYLDGGLLRPILLTVLGVLVILRHRTNIQRLLKGTENRFSFKKDKS